MLKSDAVYTQPPKKPGSVKQGVTSKMTNQFKVMSLNIFSLLPHIDEIRILAADERPHVIGINETKIDSAVDGSHIAIDEYDVIRKDRNSVGGGVALYAHKSVDFKRCDDLINSDIEAISAKIKIGNYKPFLVTSIYRPPRKPVAYFHDIELLVRDTDNQNIESIIMGDTNCNFMDKSNNDTKNLLKIMNNYNLKQVIHDYTRVTGTTKTCIDHIMTNRPECVFKSGVINCGISDHDSVYMIKKLRVPAPKLPPRTLSVRNFKKFDLKSFRKELMEVPFDQIKNVTNDANEMWLIWKAFFLDLLNKHAPITNIKVRNNKLPYVTSELRKLIRQRDYLRAKANKTGSEYIRQAFNHLRSTVNYELHHAKRNYYTCKIEQHKDNLKLTWKVLKHAIREGSSSISAIRKITKFRTW